MKQNLARRKIHEIRSALIVVNSFVGQINPADKDEADLKAVAITCLSKLHAALEDLSDLIEVEIKDKSMK